MKRALIVSVLSILAIFRLGAQEAPEQVYRLVPLEAEMTAEERLLLAVSSKDYPVTPGDVYRLTFLLANESVSNEIVVESDYTLNLNIFGKVNAENMSFAELKPIVEKRIADAYPRSLPSLRIVSVGIFQVLIKGEVTQTSHVTAWGLSRLSSVVQDQLGPYSSIREIGVVSRDGILRKYDLFKALQVGIIEEDPYILSGDVIIVYRSDRKAEILGEVFRPGEYQLLRDEGMRELINTYGRGFTNRADTARIRLDRYSGKRAQTYYFDLSKGISTSLDLQDNDVVTVPVKSSTLPIVFFEGAVVAPPSDADFVLAEAQEVGIETYNRILHPFIDGESLLDALLAIQDSLATAADLANAYLIRQEATQPIPVDLERLLFDYDPTDDIALQPFDRVIIPSLRFTVAVLGDVENAGIYPFVPQKTYSYYLSLAGGIPPGDATDYITVLDGNDKLRNLDEIIQPEDRIIVTASLISVVGAVYDPGAYPYVPGNDFEYYVRLAGGIDPELNTDNKVSISDSQGNPLEADTSIQPGDRIFVDTNDFAYNFNRYFPIITAGIAFIATIISIVDLLAN